MNKLAGTLLAGAACAALGFGATGALAQGRGGSAHFSGGSHFGGGAHFGGGYHGGYGYRGGYGYHGGYGRGYYGYWGYPAAGFALGYALGAYPWYGYGWDYPGYYYPGYYSAYSYAPPAPGGWVEDDGYDDDAGPPPMSGAYPQGQSQGQPQGQVQAPRAAPSSAAPSSGSQACGQWVWRPEANKYEWTRTGCAAG